MPADGVVVFAGHYHMRVHLRAIVLNTDIAAQANQFHFLVDDGFIVFLFILVLTANRSVRHGTNHIYNAAFYLVVVAKISE